MPSPRSARRTGTVVNARYEHSSYTHNAVQLLVNTREYKKHTALKQQRSAFSTAGYIGLVAIILLFYIDGIVSIVSQSSFVAAAIRATPVVFHGAFALAAVAASGWGSVALWSWLCDEGGRMGAARIVLAQTIAAVGLSLVADYTHRGSAQYHRPAGLPPFFRRSAWLGDRGLLVNTLLCLMPSLIAGYGSFWLQFTSPRWQMRSIVKSPMRFAVLHQAFVVALWWLGYQRFVNPANVSSLDTLTSDLQWAYDELVRRAALFSQQPVAEGYALAVSGSPYFTSMYLATLWHTVFLALGGLVAVTTLPSARGFARTFLHPSWRSVWLVAVLGLVYATVWLARHGPNWYGAGTTGTALLSLLMRGYQRPPTDDDVW